MVDSLTSNLIISVCIFNMFAYTIDILIKATLKKCKYGLMENN